MGGSNAGNHAGIYGTLGKPAAGNVPGSRRYASCWTDSKGDFWLFGGDGFDANGLEGALNDFWEFSPATNEWTWMGGSSTIGGTSGLSGVPGVYGTLKQPAASNFPGSRTGATSWTDSTGHLWLFGGDGYPATGSTYIDGYLNDLWEYDPATNEWTWMSGSSTVGASDVPPGVYGTLKTAAAGNTPGGRFGAVGWADSSGNLWLFGGGEQPTAGYGYWAYLNDLWKFDPATNEWAWMGGSNTGNQSGVYGVLGTAAAANVPGGRYFASSWMDASGHLWLFGGQGLVAGGGNLLNDLWEFSPSTNEWTWKGGSDVSYAAGGEAGVYGTLGTPAATNLPGGRWLAANWTDNGGNFWLLGGTGFDSAGNNGNLNDLWEFKPATNEWTWVSGSNKMKCVTTPPLPPSCGQNGVYGTLGTPSAANVPGGRNLSGAWADRSGNLWLFGGLGNAATGTASHLNDLWVFQPAAASLPATMPVFGLAPGTYTSAQSVKLSDTTVGAKIYYTTDGTTTPTDKSTLYTAPISVGQTTTIKAVAVAAGFANSAVATATYTIHLPSAVAPAFSPAGRVYGQAQVVTLTSTTLKAVIYYTTNGGTPTTGSTKYTGPIPVNGTETIKAIATASGFSASPVVSAAYTMVGSPHVFTGLATGIATPKATLNAMVSDVGVAGQVWFRWGTSFTNLANSTAHTALSATTATQNVSVVLTGLTGKTFYYFQPVVNTVGGTSYGAIQIFGTN